MIDGISFKSDVIVLPDRVIDRWWRKEGHRLHADDLADVVNDGPRLLIVGTGMYGRMKIPKETEAFLKGLGIGLMAMQTTDACRMWNEKDEEGGVAAAFHLTC